MQNNKSRTRLFATVSIDLFAVMVLLLLLQQQTQNIAPSVVHVVEEAANNFYPIFLDGKKKAYQYDPSDGWIPVQSAITQTHFFIRCANQTRCFDNISVSSKPKGTGVGNLIWALPLERKTIVQQEFTRLCIGQAKCNLTFIHSISGTKLENSTEEHNNDNI